MGRAEAIRENVLAMLARRSVPHGRRVHWPLGRRAGTICAAVVLGSVTIITMWNGRHGERLSTQQAVDIAQSATAPENIACSAQAKVYADAKACIAALVENARREGRVGDDARLLLPKLRKQLGQ